MRKATQNYIVFITLFLLGLFQAVSGFIQWLVLPRGGYRGGREVGTVADNTFLWQRDTWVDLHNWIAVALVVIVLIHLILHWKWIVHMTKTYFTQKE